MPSNSKKILQQKANNRSEMVSAASNNDQLKLYTHQLETEDEVNSKRHARPRTN